MSSNYSCETHKILVNVDPKFLASESHPDQSEYVWAYRVEIKNMGSEAVQLRRRHWVITDSLGRVIEVEGQGVVGEEPIIDPGSVFEYTSGTPLTTPSGIMMGVYEMERPNGEIILVKVPPFSLDSPHDKRIIN